MSRAIDAIKRTMPTPLKKRTSGLPTGSPSRNEAHLTPIDDQIPVEGDRAVQKVLANRKTQADHNAASGATGVRCIAHCSGTRSRPASEPTCAPVELEVIFEVPTLRLSFILRRLITSPGRCCTWTAV